MSRLHHAAALLVSATLPVLLSACGAAPSDPRTGAQLVRVATVGSDGQAARTFTGVVSARVQSDLGFRVPGKIIERLVNTGQVVRKGQALMRIDRTDLALATVAQVGSVEAAKARAIQTAADERRYRDLVSAGAVSASAYDQVKASADAARAQLNAAQAQANVARNQAGYSVLVADADGVVVETLAEPGQVVTAGQTVVKLAHAGPREATISLPETVRPAIGSTAVASVFNSATTGTARLRQLSGSADLQTRTYDARYVLEGAAATAPLGATVTIAVSDAKAVAAMSVPLGAIYDNGHGPGVWIIDGNPLRVTWRPVLVAGLGDETATITGGVHAGERFVALGAHEPHQGEAVRVASEQVAAQ